MTLIQLRRWRQAADFIDNLDEINYKGMDLDLLKGIVRVQLGDLNTAERFFGRSLQADPSSVDARIHLSQVLVEKASYERALALLVADDGSLRSTQPIVLLAVAEIFRIQGETAAMRNFLELFLYGNENESRTQLLEKWKRDQTKPRIDYQHYIDRIAGM